MTTGRINQVTIPQETPSKRGIPRLRHPLTGRCHSLPTMSALAIRSAGRPTRRNRPSGGKPLYLCHVFTLLHPSKLRAYHCDYQVHGMPTTYVGEECCCFFGISISTLGQGPSRTTSIPALVASRPLFSTMRSFHALSRQASWLAHWLARSLNIAASCQICHHFVPGNILPSRAYSYGPNTAQLLFRSFPMPALTLVPDFVYSPVRA